MAEASPPLILLDTHVWIWAVEGEAAALGRGAIAAIEEASQEGGLLVSAISVWEVAMLEAKGRITLSRALDDWVRTALQAPGVRLPP
jgi:PIN domain nuclease of toxin-antitoxin system